MGEIISKFTGVNNMSYNNVKISATPKKTQYASLRLAKRKRCERTGLCITLYLALLLFDEHCLLSV